MKPKYGENLYHMDTESLYFAWDIYSDIGKDDETGFETSNYEFDRQLLKGKNKKGIGLIKDKLGRKIMIDFALLRPKRYSYWADENDEGEKAKGTKKRCQKKLNLWFISK